MMRVEVGQTGPDLNLAVCGRLAERWVPELEQCWRSAQAKYPGRQFSVDLRGVTFIDDAGRKLLKSMHREGVRFFAAGVLIQGIVDQITRESK